jgi:hypothetical protein
MALKSTKTISSGQHQAGRLSTVCKQCTVQYRKHPMNVVVGVGWVGGKSPPPGQHQAGRLSTVCTQCTVQYRKHPIIAVVGGRMGGREKSCSWTASGRQTHHILYTMYCTVQETTNDCRSQSRMGGREKPSSCSIKVSGVNRSLDEIQTKVLSFPRCYSQ